jgi:hypothetical protein
VDDLPGLPGKGRNKAMNDRGISIDLHHAQQRNNDLQNQIRAREAEIHELKIKIEALKQKIKDDDQKVSELLKDLNIVVSQRKKKA